MLKKNYWTKKQNDVKKRKKESDKGRKEGRKEMIKELR